MEKITLIFVDEIGKSCIGEGPGFIKRKKEVEGLIVIKGDKIKELGEFKNCVLEIEKFREHVYGLKWDHRTNYTLSVNGQCVIFLQDSDWRVAPRDSGVKEKGGEIYFPDGTVISSPEWWNLIGEEWESTK